MLNWGSISAHLIDRELLNGNTGFESGAGKQLGQFYFFSHIILINKQ